MNDRPQTGDVIHLDWKEHSEDITIGKSKGACEVFECVDENGDKGIICFQFRTHHYYWIKTPESKEPWEA